MAISPPQGLERCLYAELLEALGRTEEAIRWYGSFSNNSIFDLVYLAPSHLRRGRIFEHLGQREAAAGTGAGPGGVGRRVTLSAAKACPGRGP